MLRVATRVAALALIVVTSCTSPPFTAFTITPTSSPVANPSPTTASATPSTSPTPSNCVSTLSDFHVKYEREQGVPGSSQRVAREGTDLAIKAYEQKVPDCDDWRVTIDLIPKSDQHFTALTRGQPPTFTIVVFASSPGWFGSSGSQKLITMLHEWYHVVEFSLYDCGSCAAGRPPGWMLEGAAVFESYQRADDLGIGSYSTLRATELFFARRAHLQLRSLGSKVTTATEYSVSFLAVEYLVGFGGGAHSLIDFWSELGRTGKLADAFQHAFGISLPSFYRRFQAYANRGYTGT